jgi:hypothetical protein
MISCFAGMIIPLTHGLRVGMNVKMLYDELENLAFNLTDSNYKDQFKMGFDFICEYKNGGGEQKIAYDKLIPLFVKYQEMNEQKSDLIGDWLDCICGWIGKEKFSIWEQHRK